MKLLAIFALTTFMSFSVLAGPFVSEGPGPVKDYLSCKNADGETVLKIRSTAAVTYVQGQYYEQGLESANLKCVKSKEDWTCKEIRSGEGLLTITASRNSQGFMIARISREDVLGRAQFIKNLYCK